MNFWKWFGESRYPGALPALLENFRRAFSPDPTDCPWVSEDGQHQTHALGKGGGIILHGPIFAEAGRAVHSYSKSDDSFDYGSIKSNVLIHLFPFERKDNE